MTPKELHDMDLEVDAMLRDTYRKGTLILASVILGIGLFFLGVFYFTNYVKDAVITAISQ